jgi:hypothetical protein
MHPFPVHRERIKPEMERREWDEFQKEAKEKRGKKCYHFR